MATVGGIQHWLEREGAERAAGWKLAEDGNGKDRRGSAAARESRPKAVSSALLTGERAEQGPRSSVMVAARRP